MAKKKQGDVSIANILAIIGLAAYGVISFFGEYFVSSGGSPVRAVFIAIALVAVLAFLLFFSIKAKGAEDNPDKWRFVEWGCLILYIGVVVAGSGPFHRFFVAVTQKEELKNAATEQFQAINNLFSEYNSQKDTHMSAAYEELKNYLASDQAKRVKNDSLANYVKTRIKTVDDWATECESILTITPDSSIEKLKEDINAWNYMRLPSLAWNLDRSYVKAWDTIQDKIEAYGINSGLIPVIARDENGYAFTGLATFDLGERPEGTFVQKLKALDGTTIAGWIVLVLLHLLVLLNYLVAPRTVVVGPGRRSGEDENLGGGLPV